MSPPHLAEAVALGATDRAGARLGPAATATRTDLVAGNLQLLLAAKDGLLERDGQVVTEVGTPLGGSAASPPGAEAKVEAEDLLENLEGVAEAEALEGRSFHRAEAVIHGPLLGVREDLVSLVYLLELGLGVGAFVDVGVILSGQPTVSSFYLVLAGVSPHAEHLVIIAFGRHSTSTNSQIHPHLNPPT